MLEFEEELAAQSQTSKKYTRPARGSPQRNVGLHTRPYVQALRRYALSNLYITNPNPNLPPVLHSGIKIPGYEEKLQCPYYNYSYSHFPQIYLNILNYAQLRLITLLLLLRYNAQTTPLRQALILARAPMPRCFGYGLFQADRSTSLPLLVFVDEALGVP